MPATRFSRNGNFHVRILEDTVMARLEIEEHGATDAAQRTFTYDVPMPAIKAAAVGDLSQLPIDDDALLERWGPTIVEAAADALHID